MPYERGFFKDDESIMHPFHGSTIPSSTLYAVGFTIPVITVGLPSFLFLNCRSFSLYINVSQKFVPIFKEHGANI